MYDVPQGSVSKIPGGLEPKLASPLADFQKGQMERGALQHALLPSLGQLTHELSRLGQSCTQPHAQKCRA